MVRIVDIFCCQMVSWTHVWKGGRDNDARQRKEWIFPGQRKSEQTWRLCSYGQVSCCSYLYIRGDFGTFHLLLLNQRGSTTKILWVLKNPMEQLFVGLSAGMLLRFQFGCYTLIDIDVLEIPNNLNKFGKTMAKPSTALLERSFSMLSHLCRRQKSSHMKIQGDGRLIDIDVSLLKPDTEQLLCKEQALHHGNLGGI